MGCFSYKCKVCGSAIIHEEHCKLFFLSKGKIVETQEGDYDSYGRAGGNMWSEDWNMLVDLHFGKDNTSGFAAVHLACIRDKKYTPRTRSADDPNQGAGTPREKFLE